MAHSPLPWPPPLSEIAPDLCVAAPRLLQPWLTSGSLGEADIRLQERFDKLAREAAAKRYSQDPLVGGLADHIERERPGLLRFLNRPIVGPGQRTVTELDIETDSAVIQVRSSVIDRMHDRDGRRLTSLIRQLRLTETVADRPVAGYAPYIAPDGADVVRRAGHLVFDEPNALLRWLSALQRPERARPDQPAAVFSAGIGR